MGLVAAVTLAGKVIPQKLLFLGKDKQNDEPLKWDNPFPKELSSWWQYWKNQLPELESLSIDRCCNPKKFGPVTRNEVHAFSDISKEAFGAVVYLKQVSQTVQVSTNLAFNQAQVASIRATSIPQLELCGAVLFTKTVEKLKTELDLKIDTVLFYIDVKVVLGYINNDVLHVYVANHVQSIRNVSDPRQLRYVDTSINPADVASRGTTVKALI